MGQQQLLLLVLGMVIVGIAVVAGIQAFSEGSRKAKVDAAVSEALRIASDLQAWALKPKAFGGGGGSFTGATFAKIGYNKSNGPDEFGYFGTTNNEVYYWAPAGCFQMNVVQSDSVVIDGYAGRNGSTGCDTNSDQFVQVAIGGMEASDITTTTFADN